MTIKLCENPIEVHGYETHRCWLYPGEPKTIAPGLFAMLMNPVTDGQARPALHIQSLHAKHFEAPISDGPVLVPRGGHWYGVVTLAYVPGPDGRCNKAFVELVKIGDERKAG